MTSLPRSRNVSSRFRLLLPLLACVLGGSLWAANFAQDRARGVPKIVASVTIDGSKFDAAGKPDGEAYAGFNVLKVERDSAGLYRVDFVEPINPKKCAVLLGTGTSSASFNKVEDIYFQIVTKNQDGSVDYRAKVSALIVQH